jgi:hypothetical protein
MYGINTLPYYTSSSLRSGYANGGISSLPNYMGGGYLDQYGRQQYGLGKFVKK